MSNFHLQTYKQVNILLIISIVIISFLTLIFLYDIIQRKHTILHNFPIVGHFRYIFEAIGPELRQYWVATDKEEMPFSRAERSWVYATSKNKNNNFGFGTTEIYYETGYPILKHATFPVPEFPNSSNENTHYNIPCAKIIGKAHNRKFVYRPSSVINISAMSFGSLGKNAISALNLGAKSADCYHNTGEGGISPYHKKGADLVWQIGTGYFGARDSEGNFSKEIFKDTVDSNPNIKMIEVKLSQGAKPGKGGILPKTKITEEISSIRGISMNKDCISPNCHTAFANVDEMIEFIEQLSDISGLPIGIKSAVGELNFWKQLAIKMKEQTIGPDFITIDGGEGGTGAAPLAFSDHVSLPFKVGFKRVYEIFNQLDMAQNIIWIGSSKLGIPDRAIVGFAMGCDIINVAREAMLSIGCIQAQQCHTDHCPTGVATHNKWLQHGLDIKVKAKRCSQYIIGLRKEMLQLSHACGYEHPCQFTGQDIEMSTGVNLFKSLDDVMNYKKIPVPFSSMDNLRN